MATKYIVTAGNAGRFYQGEVITKEDAQPWFDKWVAEGAIREATKDEAGADDSREVDSAARAPENTTGDDKVAEGQNNTKTGVPAPVKEGK